MAIEPILRAEEWTKYVEDNCRLCAWCPIFREKFFCYVCKQTFCDHHVGEHSCLGIPDTVLISEVDESHTVRQKLLCCRQVVCACNNISPIAIYCYAEKAVMCKACVRRGHMDHKNVSILRKCASYKKANFSAVTERTKKLLEENNQLLNERQIQTKSFVALKENAKRNFQKFETVIIKHFNSKEQAMLEDLESRTLEYLQKIKHHVRKCSDNETSLQSYLNCLNEIHRNNFKADMFATDLIVSKRLTYYELDINYMQQSPSLILKRTETLRSLMIKINTLAQSFEVTANNGKAITFSETMNANLTGTEIYPYHTGEVRPDRRRQYIKQKISFSTEELYDDARGVSGCVFMPDDKAVLCTECVVLLNDSLRLIDRLQLPNKMEPFDVSVVDETSVIITLPKAKQIQYINVESKQLNPGRILQLDNSYYGVEVVGKTIYATLIESSESAEIPERRIDNKAEVQCLDLNGKLLKRFGVNKDGSYLFKSPYYLTVNASSGKIFVSDEATDIVTCLNVDGTVACQYKDPNLESPRGLCTYGDDSVMVVSKEYLHIVTTNGEKQRLQLFYELGYLRYSARSIAYRQKDETMIIGLHDDEDDDDDRSGDCFAVNRYSFDYWWSFFE